MSELGVCDVCGKPARSVAVDLQDRTRINDAHRRYAPIGEVKRGCDQHPVRSEIRS